MRMKCVGASAAPEERNQKVKIEEPVEIKVSVAAGRALNFDYYVTRLFCVKTHRRTIHLLFVPSPPTARQPRPLVHLSHLCTLLGTTTPRPGPTASPPPPPIPPHPPPRVHAPPLRPPFIFTATANTHRSAVSGVLTPLKFHAGSRRGLNETESSKINHGYV